MTENLPKSETEGIKKPSKVVIMAILVPMRGLVDANFHQGYMRLFLHLMKIPNLIPVPIYSEAVPVDKARNMLLKEAIIANCDYSLWLDADIYLTTEGFNHLYTTVQLPDKDVVSGIYYERAPPYNPVLRMEAEFNKMKIVYDYPTDKLFEVDGMGMGCVMMTRKAMNAVFKAHGGEPFYFNKEASEDLNFSRNLRKLGYKITVNPLVQCTHIGASVGQWHYLHHKLDEYTEVKELAKYLGEKPEVTLNNTMDAQIQMVKDWKAVFGDKKEKDLSEEEIEEFYKNCNYLYDLTNFWMRGKLRRNSVFANVTDKHRKILDFGCGIGDFGLTMLEDFPDSHVVFYDINKKNMAYLRDRVKKNGFGDRCIVTENVKEIPKEQFDLIFCLDMLEYLKNPAKALSYLRSHLTPTGLLLATVASKSPFQPQHISEITIHEHGFMRLNDCAYIRDDSELAKNTQVRMDKIATTKNSYADIEIEAPLSAKKV